MDSESIALIKSFLEADIACSIIILIFALLYIKERGKS
jgi:hypothetical protein